MELEQYKEGFPKKDVPHWQPYWYQQQCLNVLGGERQFGKQKALVVMASGLGKTVIAAFDAKQFLDQRQGSKVLFLCHQNDILEQANGTFQSILGTNYTYGYLARGQKDFNADIIFSSFQTMRNCREKFSHDYFDYIIVDESHHTHAETYLPTLQYFKPRFLLGITATPDRADFQDIRQVYGEETYSLPLENALAIGLLTPVDYRLLTDEIQRLDGLNTLIGRLSIKKLNRILFVPRRDEEIIRIIQEKTQNIENPRVMIFSPTIEYCNRLANMSPLIETLHSDLSVIKQKKILKAFREREINTIITVDKFNEGIDIPDANVIVFLRSTSSRTIFFQQLGRGLRRSEGKDRVLVLDFVGNCERLEMVHNLWGSVREKGQEIRTLRMEIEEPLEVDVGDVEFEEMAKEVLEIIKGLRSGQIKEVYLNQLREVANSLGRVPRKIDVDLAAKKGMCVSSATYTRNFGSFGEALHQARLNMIKRFRTREDHLSNLKKVAKELGRIPTIGDLEGVGLTQGGYKYVFGSFGKALEEAGLRKEKTKWLKWSDEKLIEDLKVLAKDLARTPSRNDVTRAIREGRIMASKSTYTQRFGSWNNALKRAVLIE